MNNRLLIFLLLFFLAQTICAQSVSPFTIREDMEFARYLMNEEKYEEVVFLLQKTNLNSFQNKDLQDSLFFTKGWAFYHLKALDSSAVFLSKVSQRSSLYAKSQFFAAYSRSYLGQYVQSNQLLESLQLNDDAQLSELRHLQLSGNALLQNDFQKFEEHSQFFTGNYYQMATEEADLQAIATDLQNFRPKSMLAAGLMSAIVPGSGKFYTGKYGEGMSVLITTGALAAITFENYRKNGIKDLKTIAFGSLFSIFYIGNIYGSVFSVKLYREEFYESYHHHIRFHLHIPLRNVFN